MGGVVEGGTSAGLGHALKRNPRRFLARHSHFGGEEPRRQCLCSPLARPLCMAPLLLIAGHYHAKRKLTGRIRVTIKEGDV